MQLHKTQASILHSLRYAETERFNALMHLTEHTSDTFKFHLRKLIKLGYITKAQNGAYKLTAEGKEYANNFNEQQRSIEKQPKISVLMIISKVAEAGNTVYLFQKRSRNPFYGYWGEVHGRAQWGEAFEVTAQKQLKRQTGLSANFTVQGFRRVRDFDVNSEGLLEDKLFVILSATDICGELTNTYDGGENTWLTLEEIRAKNKVFESSISNIENLGKSHSYSEHDFTYNSGDY